MIKYDMKILSLFLNVSHHRFTKGRDPALILGQTPQFAYARAVRVNGIGPVYPLSLLLPSQFFGTATHSQLSQLYQSESE